ncbi:MAG TPA: hypothetical protein PLB63_02735 [Planctomycetota bacterium]|nr:hypothetical protein [Planctomycetota bacterium]HQA99866.1 hypothetical protein [Planctomycetota bacterium]
MGMEYYSFEKVLRELQMEEDELKRLVSEGEIRAFRDDDKMKFRKSDIDGLKKGRMTEPTIILPSGEPEDSEDSEVLLVEEDTSETLLDIEDLDSTSSSTSVPHMDFAFSDAISSSASETITEELTFEEESGSYVLDASDDVLIDSSEELTAISEAQSRGETFIDSDTGLETEPLDMGLGILDASGDFQLGTDSGFGFDEAPKGHYKPQAYHEAEDPGKMYPAHMPMSYVEEEYGTPFKIALVATTVFMLLTGLFMMNLPYSSDNAVTAVFTDQVVEVPALAPVHLKDGSGNINAVKKREHLNKRNTWRTVKR